MGLIFVGYNLFRDFDNIENNEEAFTVEGKRDPKMTRNEWATLPKTEKYYTWN